MKLGITFYLPGASEAERGPHTIEDLFGLAKAGRLKPNDLVNYFEDGHARTQPAVLLELFDPKFEQRLARAKATRGLGTPGVKLLDFSSQAAAMMGCIFLAIFPGVSLVCFVLCAYWRSQAADAVSQGADVPGYNHLGTAMWVHAAATMLWVVVGTAILTEQPEPEDQGITLSQRVESPAGQRVESPAGQRVKSPPVVLA